MSVWKGLFSRKKNKTTPTEETVLKPKGKENQDINTQKIQQQAEIEKIEAEKKQNRVQYSNAETTPTPPNSPTSTSPVSQQGFNYSNFDPSKFQSQLNDVRQHGQQAREAGEKSNQANVNKTMLEQQCKTEALQDREKLLSRFRHHDQGNSQIIMVGG